MGPPVSFCSAGQAQCVQAMHDLAVFQSGERDIRGASADGSITGVLLMLIFPGRSDAFACFGMVVIPAAGSIKLRFQKGEIRFPSPSKA